jgi:hypothetical protein
MSIAVASAQIRAPQQRDVLIPQQHSAPLEP